MLFFETAARLRGFEHIAGVDEAGRGPLAGPLVVAACILPEGKLIEGADDSKKLTAAKRRSIYKKIRSDSSVIYRIEVIDPSEIDKLNIFQATLEGMRRCIERLTLQPDFILVDGPHTPFSASKSQGIVKGDSLSCSIACASILAKVTRDEIMEGYDDQFPLYGFARHKGYPTPQHLQALKEHGPTSIHRMSYSPVQEALL